MGKGKCEEKRVIQSSEVQQVESILTQHVGMLRVSLQQASGANSGPEEGSDAWLLLDALISNDRHPALIARFEQSGRALAEQGGKLETRLQGLQLYMDALLRACQQIFTEESSISHIFPEAISPLHQIKSLSILPLTTVYHYV